MRMNTVNIEFESFPIRQVRNVFHENPIIIRRER